MSSSTTFPVRLLTAPLRYTLFDPRATAALLVAILYYPEKLRRILPPYLHFLTNSPKLIKTLTAFLSLGIVRGANRKLSQYAANNWKADAKFVKSQEIVLITGGASGIGELMAREFAGKGVKVIAMDLREPKVAFRRYPLPQLPKHIS